MAKSKGFVASELLPQGCCVPVGTLFVVQVQRDGLWFELSPVLGLDSTRHTLAVMVESIPRSALRLVAVKGDVRFAVFPEPRTHVRETVVTAGLDGVARLVAQHVPGTAPLLAPLLAFLSGDARSTALSDLRARWDLREGFTHADLAKQAKVKRAKAHPDACRGDRTEWDAVERELELLKDHAR